MGKQLRLHALLISIILIGCSAPSTNTPQPRLRTGITQFSSLPSLERVSVVLVPDEPLEDAFERVRQAYHTQNIDTFDARRAYATSASGSFLWYFTINDATDPFGRTNHVFFVTTSEWTDEATRAFLISYLVMPGAPLSETGRPWFHVYSAYDVPPAVEFIFSNTAAGALEAAVLSELGTDVWQPDNAHFIAQRAMEIIERFNYGTPEELSARCPEQLDSIYTALGTRPPVERPGVFWNGYLPEGTLAAVGLLVGESIRAQLPGAAHWEADDASDVYPRLRITEVAEGILRPISLMIEFYAAEADMLPTIYCERMIESLVSGVSEP